MDGIAYLAAGILIAVALLQALLAAGLPLGRLAWGGRHHGVLPFYLRVASAAAVPVLVAFAYVVLNRAGLIGTPGSSVPAFAVAGFLGLNALMKFASRAPLERWIMGPLAVVAAVATAIIAISG